MDSFLPVKISSSALSAQRLRLALIASNLANVHTTQTPEGGPYRRKDLVVAAVPMGGFRDSLINELGDATATDPTNASLFESHLRGVEPLRVATDDREPLIVHAPWHPEADSNGNVKMPNISVIEEMVNMMAIQRAYEANVAVIKSAKAMVDQAMQIGQSR